jgi:hypothetical protein
MATILLTSSFERPKLNWTGEWILLLILCYLQPLVSGVSGLILDNLVPLILSWWFSAFGSPVLDVLPKPTFQHFLDASFEIRECLEFTLCGFLV